MSKKRLGIPLLVAVGLMLAAAGIAYSDMKMTNWVDAWDFGAGTPRFTHSLQDMPTDCSWVPFWHEFDFDDDPYPTSKDLAATYYVTETGVAPYPHLPSDGICPNGAFTPTQWASVFEYAVYYDNPGDPFGFGFKDTRNWELVRCDRDGDNDFDADDLSWTPPYTRTTLIDDPGDRTLGFEVLASNVEVACSVGNCDSELITTLFVNFDTDCDGAIDTTPINEAGGITHSFASLWNTEGLCFYAEAQTPCEPEPMWGSGNIQARITRIGGEKTINFHQDPDLTPVELSSLTARWAEARSQPLIVWVAIAGVAAAALGALTWRLRPARL